MSPHIADVAQLVECVPSKYEVAGSNPVIRSILPFSITVVRQVLVLFVVVRIHEGQLTIKTNVMGFFMIYYLICLTYCLYMSFKKWNRDVRTGGLGITPGMDTMAMLIMCWALAPVDIFLTWVRVYKEAEEARRRADRENNVF